MIFLRIKYKSSEIVFLDRSIDRVYVLAEGGSLVFLTSGGLISAGTIDRSWSQ